MDSLCHVQTELWGEQAPHEKQNEGEKKILGRFHKPNRLTDVYTKAGTSIYTHTHRISMFYKLNIIY